MFKIEITKLRHDIFAEECGVEMNEDSPFDVVYLEVSGSVDYISKRAEPEATLTEVTAVIIDRESDSIEGYVNALRNLSDSEIEKIKERMIEAAIKML